MSQWITDRKPTSNDAPNGYVWTTINDRTGFSRWDAVKDGVPWMPMLRPDPYVKPKRWVVDWIYYCNCYVITDGELRIHLYQLQSRDDAQRICDIYNEVLP